VRSESAIPVYLARFATLLGRVECVGPIEEASARQKKGALPPKNLERFDAAVP